MWVLDVVGREQLCRGGLQWHRLGKGRGAWMRYNECDLGTAGNITATPAWSRETNRAVVQG